MARALEIYVRALLGARRVAAPAVRDAPAGTPRAFGDALGLQVPAAFPMYGGAAGRRARFAAAAHLACHVAFGGGRWARAKLRPIQIVLVSLLEDARVELLGARELPGLGPLWAGLHRATPADHPTFEALCARLSRALADPSYADGHPFVAKARALFFHPDHELARPDGDGCRRIGSLLGNDIGQMRLPFNARTYLVEPPYRDDHRLLWEEPADDAHPRLEEVEREREIEVESAPADGPPDAAAAATSLARYPEWDYQIRSSRPDWCTVREQAPPPVAPSGADAADAAEAAPDARAARLARILRLESLVARQRARHGDALDLDAAVAAVVERRARRTPDLRVYRSLRRRRREMAVLVLLDLSASTAPIVGLTRAATLLLGDVLASARAPFAIHGFSSNGRHEVEYHRLKELGAPWDAAASARVGAVAPRLSTRMGAALRHAGRCLRDVRRDRRLVLLLTDGEPSDVDAPDPAYLLQDARHAVAEQHRRGVHVFAVSLDPAGDQYARRIFGDGGYWIVDRVDRLPEALPRIYARLVR